MLKSITDSPKAEIRKNSKVEYNFSQVLQNIPGMNGDINNRIQEYEECQALSIKKAGQMRLR